MPYTQQGFKNNWREIWTGKESEKGYRYERIEKVQKEDQDIWRKLCDASNSNPPEDGTSVTRGGFKFWFNANGPYGPSVARRQHDESFGQQKDYQGQNYTVKQPAESYIPKGKDVTLPDILESIDKRFQNVERMLTEITLALGKNPFEKASEVKSNTPNDHGNETSGSHYASGPGTLTEVQGSINSAPEARVDDVSTTENEDLTPGQGLTEEEERLLQP